MQLTHTGPPRAASRRCQALAASPGTARGHVLPMPCLHLYLLPCRQGMSPGPTNNNVLRNVKQKRQQHAPTAPKSWVPAAVPFLSCQNWTRLKCPHPPVPEQCRPKKPYNSCMGTWLSVLSPHHILPVTHGASLPPYNEAKHTGSTNLLWRCALHAHTLAWRGTHCVQTRACTTQLR